MAPMSEGRLQVLIAGSPAGPLVAGLPPAVRAAHRAAAELSRLRILFCGRDAAFQRRWRRQLAGCSAACIDGQPAAAVLDAQGPLLVLSAAGFPEPEALRRFVARAAAESRATRWVCDGRPVAAYFPTAAPLLAGDCADVALRALQDESPAEPVKSPGWVAADDAGSAAAAERLLFAALPKDTDGYLARYDRRLSIALSSVLLRWPVTPNAITTASLALGLLGAWWLASGSYAETVAGALLLWFCCLLDGCDGEVARLKLLCSPTGAAYDLAADHLSHLATFIAIPVAVHRAHPQADLWPPGILLISGFLACLFTVWYLVLRKPESERGPYALVIERVASRDYVYLIVALALIGRLEWFLYAAAVGSHLFWIALWLLPV